MQQLIFDFFHYVGVVTKGKLPSFREGKSFDNLQLDRLGNAGGGGSSERFDLSRVICTKIYVFLPVRGCAPDPDKCSTMEIRMPLT